jgi:hypothetical protein
MRRGEDMSKRLISCCAAGLFLQLLSGGVLAENGIDFAGSCDFTDVVDQGDAVSLRFSAEVFNYSGMDVTAATILLTDLTGLEEYAAATEIGIPYRESVRISGVVMIPKLEYELWQEAPPNLIVEFESAAQTIRRPVELTRLAGGGQ